MSIDGRSHLVKGNIESSTDTLVPEDEVDGKSRKEPSTATTTSSATTAAPPIPPPPPPPPPPVTEPKPSPAAFHSSFHHRHQQNPIDSDGLIAHDNRVQRRLVEIMTSHANEVQVLRRDLYHTRKALTQSQNSLNALNGATAKKAAAGLESLLHVTTSNGGSGASSKATASNGGATDGEDSTSGIQTSSTNSDASSWEAVDDREGNPTLWVPDHALGSCMRYNFISLFM